jgi:hypothetical protein
MAVGLEQGNRTCYTEKETATAHRAYSLVVEMDTCNVVG